jgi:hypothetical protein
MTGHWINTVSLEHVRLGVEDGFTQADHGRDTRLRRLQPGDRIAFYSPRTAMRAGSPVQAFTALGWVAHDAAPYQVQVSADFRPRRLAVDFEPCRHAPARPLVERLSFVRDPARWGLPFRRGLFAVQQADFEIIAAAMATAAEPAISAP